MTSSTLALLIFGILFTLLGIAACSFYHWKRAKAYVPLTIGLFTIYLPTIGPLSNCRERLEAITHLDPHQIVFITLEPTRNSSYSDISLVRYNHLISDTPTLLRIARLLQQAVIGSEGDMKTPTQVGRIEITLRDRPPLIFGLRKKGAATCINVDSNGEDGWHYGKLDVPGFGPLLDSLCGSPIIPESGFEAPPLRDH